MASVGKVGQINEVYERPGGGGGSGTGTSADAMSGSATVTSPAFSSLDFSIPSVAFSFFGSTTNDSPEVTISNYSEEVENIPAESQTSETENDVESTVEIQCATDENDQMPAGSVVADQPEEEVCESPEIQALPEFGPRLISQELYDKLRAATPSPEIRDSVNEGFIAPFPDEALPGLTVTERLQADHIVSMDNIVRMEGFDNLTWAEMMAVLNYRKNFIGLSETANKSKGAKSYATWTTYAKGGIDVEPAFREKMMQVEVEVAKQLQQMIDKFQK